MTDTRPAPARAWRIVLEKIEQDLLEGALGPGDRLPAERELAAQLGVGRSSVREALRVLEVMGLIRTATGSGPQAGAIVVATPGGGLSVLLRLQVAAQGFPLTDVVRTRIVLEEAVVSALVREDRRDTSSAHRILDAMEDTALSPTEFLALDARFHLSLAEASGNSVIAATMTALRDAIESYVVAGAERVADWRGMATTLRAEHRALLSAVDEGDEPHAVALVRAHISGYYDASGFIEPPG